MPDNEILSDLIDTMFLEIPCRVPTQKTSLDTYKEFSGLIRWLFIYALIVFQYTQFFTFPSPQEQLQILSPRGSSVVILALVLS